MIHKVEKTFPAHYVDEMEVESVKKRKEN